MKKQIFVESGPEKRKKRRHFWFNKGFGNHAEIFKKDSSTKKTTDKFAAKHKF